MVLTAPEPDVNGATRRVKGGKMGWPTGFEPATTSSTSLDSTVELWPPARAYVTFRPGGSQARRSFQGRRISTDSPLRFCRGKISLDKLESQHLNYPHSPTSAGSLFF